MDLRQIQYFVCLFEEGNVTRAARRLNVVQPALSMQIAKLEAETGEKLFERSAQGMIPTTAGRTMYRLFLPILRDIAAAKQEMANLSGTVAGQLNVGLLASVTLSVLSRAVEAFVGRYPEVELSVTDGYTAIFVEQVTSGQLDIAVVNRPRRRLALTVEDILNEDMVLVSGTMAGPGIPDAVRLAELSRLKLVIPSKRHGLRTVLDQATESHGIDLVPGLEIDALIPIAELVARTDWVTVLPSIVVNEGLAAGTLRAHAIDPPIVRTLAWIHHPRRPLSPAAVRFKETMNAHLLHAARSLPTITPALPAADGT
ncbi:LysR family transcriptional regulator [Azospirillum sp. ST 5-10]|uniref:LysR family transcriptional regulator n=1 Tax=unclassified Azospirillum TaxID=2630922 RepID=UPI003F49C895